MQILDRSEPKLQALQHRLAEISDLESAALALHWDRATYMPSGASEARGRQLATLRRIAHEKLTDPAMEDLLDQLRECEANLPYDSHEASLVRVTRGDRDRAARIPPDLVSRLTVHQTEAYRAWIEARSLDDFDRVRPYLEKTLDFSRELADCSGGYDRLADPLIDLRDRGTSVATIQPLFDRLRDVLVPLVEAISQQSPSHSTSVLEREFDESQQLEFSRKILYRIGYDFQRGRQDRSPHPFTIALCGDDVRIATRLSANNLNRGLFGTLHEVGHALYQQNIDRRLERTPLARGISTGLQESQARLWENLVGRSRAFWEHFYPWLQSGFLSQLGAVSIETFYRDINRVQRSPLRIEADEVTYNLHVILRFELELDLLEGRLSVRDLPEAWNERYRRDLGVVPSSDRDGVLQDVHWYSGTIGGMFQGYALGNLMGAQIYEAALTALPEIPVEMEQGNFTPLMAWLRDRLYRHGRKYEAGELVERISGQPLGVDPFVRYLQGKYGELYNFPAR